ncbi:MAG: type VI secretion system-associated FHA domain protein TagH [Beijerinckiaceae bacterium]
MVLTLTIENATSLPNGAPLSIRLTEGCNLDIGRGANLDWSLPDASRFVSTKHCEVRYRDNGYWLYDVSTNGTFINDDARRMQAPHRLRHGDRVTIGPYVIFVTAEGEEAEEAAPPIWPETAERAPPPPVITEVAPRASASAFGLELDRQINFAAPNSALAPDEKYVAPPLVAPVQDASGGRESMVDAAPERARPQALVFRRRNDGARPPLAVSPPDWEDERPRYHAPLPASTPASVSAPPPASPQNPDAYPAGEPAARAALTPPLPAAVEQPRAAPMQAHADVVGAEAFIRRFAQGAGIPEQVLARRDPLELAEELGILINLIAENLKQLLSARSEAKRFTRAGNQTMIQALDNNPLKFAPTTEDALKIMLGPRTRGYLDAQRTLEAAFRDLQTHQIKTFSAMQGAVKMLVEDLDPEEIDAGIGPDERVSGWLGNRKARLWDVFLARWQAKTEHQSDGVLSAFMQYFAECYDQLDD